jgi:hypothetical protein
MAPTIQNCGWEFKFQCPQKWRMLAATADKKVRFCKVCSRDVHRCFSDAQVIEQMAMGHCVATNFPMGDDRKRVIVGQPEGA